MEALATMSDPFAHRLQDSLSWWMNHGSGVTSSLTGGGAVAAAETELCLLTGADHALLVHSGTAALRAALVAAGIEREDEVIVSGFDWPAATAAVLSLGARPVFADVDTTATISPGSVSRLAGPRTRGLVATHLFGNPANIPELREAVGPDCVVIEDAAHALGGSLAEAAVGVLGDIACFSLGAGKAVDAGEAGAVVTSRPDIWPRLVQATQHPLRQTILGCDAPDRVVFHSRVHPAAAILAAHQLTRVADTLQARRTEAHCLLGFVEELGLVGLHRLRTLSGASPTWHRIALVVEEPADRDEVLSRLEHEGIGAAPSPIQSPLAAQLGVKSPLPMAERLCARLLAIGPPGQIQRP
jgi:perosamine synthetase